MADRREQGAAGALPAPLRQVWLADWSDEEQVRFEQAHGGAAPQVLRSAPLGASVGSRWHRLRSWPAYAVLAARGRRGAGDGAVLVAWQPLAGALALLPGRRPPVVVLNPILYADSTSPRQRVVLALLRRAERVVLYSSAARRDAVALGLDPVRLVVVPLGVAARPAPDPDPGAPVLAAGRDHRDWEVLARAAELSGVTVLVAGPDEVPAPLQLVRPAGREGFEELVRRCRAVVVPLRDGTRQAGTLAVLDALATGRPVITTRGPGTVDYVDDRCGRLVEPGDAVGLAEALRLTSEASALSRWSAGAREVAQELSLAGFVDRVGQVVAEAAADAPRRHR